MSSRPAKTLVFDRITVNPCRQRRECGVEKIQRFPFASIGARVRKPSLASTYTHTHVEHARTRRARSFVKINRRAVGAGSLFIMKIFSRRCLADAVLVHATHLSAPILSSVSHLTSSCFRALVIPDLRIISLSTISNSTFFQDRVKTKNFRFFT